MVKTAKEIMTTKLVTISSEETVAKAVSKMEEFNVKEIPVVDDKGTLLGAITYYDVLDVLRNVNEKVSSLMITSPTANFDTEINELAKLIIGSGIESIPIVENGKIKGILSDYDILKQSINDKRIKNLKVKDLMKVPPKMLKGDDPISTARRIMRFFNIDRLPVVRDDGRNYGLIISLDILRMFYKMPSQRMGKKDRAGESTNPLLMPVKNLMRKNVPEVHTDDSVTSALKKMLDSNLRGLQVLDDKGKVVGLLHRLDILDRLVEKSFEDGVWIKFSGEHLPFDAVEVVKDYIATDVKRLKYLLPNLVSVDVHIKKLHGANPNKWNYEINVSLSKSAGKREIIKTKYGYNLMFTVKEALEKLTKKLESKYKNRRKG